MLVKPSERKLPVVKLCGDSSSGETRDQREWVFEVREVKSENKKLSLFFEKCKVKKNAFTLFREVKSEIKML